MRGMKHVTDFLVKIFVKDYQNTGNADVRTSYGVLSSIVGTVCNVLLFTVKLVIGLFMHSLAIMADAFNNLSDAASSVISFIGVKMANKPADKELKLWMSFFNRKLGKRIQSKVMLATSADSLGDVFTTSATIVSILICHFTSVNIDAVAGLVVSLIVMWAGISIAKDTLEPLIGQGVDPDLYRRIVKEVKAYDGIVGTHDLIVHNYGPGRSIASIHAEVPRDVDIEVSHEIIDKIEREVGAKLNILLVIHMDPVETHDAEVLAIKEKLQNIIAALDPELAFHDFRLVKGQKRINLIFDLEIPLSYGQKESERVVSQLRALMQEIDPRYECVIDMDKSFVAAE